MTAAPAKPARLGQRFPCWFWIQMKLAAFFEIVGNGFCYAVAGYGGSGVQLVGRTGFDGIIPGKFMYLTVVCTTCLCNLLIVSPKTSFIECQGTIDLGCPLKASNSTCITSVRRRHAGAK